MSELGAATSLAPMNFWNSVYADALAHIPPDDRARIVRSAAGLVLRTLLSSSGFRCSLVYRVGHHAGRLGFVGRGIASALNWFNRHWYGCSIASTARIEGGLILPHPHGIVIGAEACVGPRAWIFQNVTIGGIPGKAGMPKVGADARVYAGAVVVGPIVIGDRVQIGACAVVFRDVPGGASVRAPDPIMSIPE